MTEPLEEQMGDTMVCDKVGLGMVQLLVFSPVIKEPVLLDGWNSLGRIYDNCVPLRGSIFSQVRGVQRNPLPKFAIFQKPTAQNIQNTNMAHFVLAYSTTHQALSPSLYLILQPVLIPEL